MFKNCVFKPSVDTVEWLKAASVRAIKTMAQAALGIMGTGIFIHDIDWVMVISASIVAGIASILTSVAGIKEVKAKE